MTHQDAKMGRKVLFADGESWRVVRITGKTDDGRIMVHGKGLGAAVPPGELHLPYRTGRRVKERK